MITTRELYEMSFRMGVDIQMKEHSGQTINGQAEWNKLEDKTGRLKNIVLLNDDISLKYNINLKPIYEMMKVYIEKFRMDGPNEFSPKSNHFFCQLMNLVDKKSNFEIKLNKIMQIGFNAGQLSVFIDRNTLPSDRIDEIKKFIQINNMFDLDTYVSSDVQDIINNKYLREFHLNGGYYKKKMSRSSKRKISKKKTNYRGGMPIEIPDWVKIVDFRTMNDNKKQCAVSGCPYCQTEWMIEEINEFYEAISIGKKDEIEDEAIGLIRTYQQFHQVPEIVELWYKVRNDVLQIFHSRELFDSAFLIWHDKKLKKKQAMGVTSQQLIDVAQLQW
jgi:hypothetical protein